MTRGIDNRSLQTILFQETVAAQQPVTIEKMVDQAVTHGAVDSHEVRIHEFLQAGKNNLDGNQDLLYDEVAVVDRAKGSLAEMRNILKQLRTLNVEGLRLLNSRERRQLDADYQYLKRSFEAVANDTNFRGIPILAANSQDLSIKVRSPGLSLVGLDAFRLAPDQELAADGDDEDRFFHNVNSQKAAAASLAVIDQALGRMDDLLGGLNGVENRMIEVVKYADLRQSAPSLIPDRSAAQALALETVTEILHKQEKAIEVATADPLTGLSMLGDIRPRW